MQVLEGEKSIVLDLYATLSSDARHHGAIVLIEEETEKREFADWSMAFCNLSDPELQKLPGFSHFMNTTLSNESVMDDSSKVLELLDLFRKH